MAYVQSRCSETVNGINVIFCGEVAIHHMPTPFFFFFFKILKSGILRIFFCFSLTQDPMGVQIAKPI